MTGSFNSGLWHSLVPARFLLGLECYAHNRPQRRSVDLVVVLNRFRLLSCEAPVLFSQVPKRFW
jgi:hypothetical protein